MSYECSIKDESVIGIVLGLNRVKVWKYTSSPLYGLFCSQHQYTFKCLEPYIGTHIGSQGITYECSIKDESVIGIILGLNRVKVWKYTSSPLYGLFCSQLQHTFKCLEPYIGTHFGYKSNEHVYAMKNLNCIGVVLDIHSEWLCYRSLIKIALQIHQFLRTCCAPCLNGVGIGCSIIPFSYLPFQSLDSLLAYWYALFSTFRSKFIIAPRTMRCLCVYSSIVFFSINKGYIKPTY